MNDKENNKPLIFCKPVKGDKRQDMSLWKQEPAQPIDYKAQDALSYDSDERIIIIFDELPQWLADHSANTLITH